MSTGSEGPTKPRSGSGRFSKKIGDAAKPGDPEELETGATEAETDSLQVVPSPGRRPQHLEPRFHIFVIDTRWNSVASKVLQENMGLISDLNSDDLVYFVDRDNSVALLRKYGSQIGRDPIICVHDLRPIHRRRLIHTHGFRMHLGILRKESQVLAALQTFARFIRVNRMQTDVEAAVRRTLRHEGLAGAIEIMGGGPGASQEVLGLG